MSGSIRVEPVRRSDAIAGAETWIIEPPGLDVALRVSIARPAAPVLGPPPAGPLAIMYTTDADHHYGTVVDTARTGGTAGEIAAAIVVGIGYADETGDLTFTEKRRIFDFYRGSRRAFDMGEYGVLEFGGGDAFLAALRDCIIPEVERRIGNIDASRRILLGTSAGGHFAAHALTQCPALFRGYALMSPVLVDFPEPPGAAALVRAVEDLPEGTFPPGTRVFLSAGAHEEDPGEMLASIAIVSNIHRMRTALARHGVVTELALFAGERHVSVPGAAISRALRFLLPGPQARSWA